MSRRWRVQFKDAVYHVASRGNGGHKIFLAYYHLVETCGMSQTRVGKYFAVSGNAVSMGIRRMKTLAEKEKK